MILTFSTGLVSVNLPVTANAQKTPYLKEGMGTPTSKPNNYNLLNRIVRLVLAIAVYYQEITSFVET